MRIAIIGAGAAGCFAAINIKRLMPYAEVEIYEAAKKALAKVAVTGGGRCNITNSFEHVLSTDEVYPRGARLMKRLLREFSHKDAYQWFEEAGIRLVTQDDQCVFPVSQDAMEVVNKLLGEMHRQGVRLHLAHRVVEIQHVDNYYFITFADGSITESDIVVVTTGGSPKMSGLKMLEPLGLEMIEPVPSLFSLAIEAGHPLTKLMGTVVEETAVSIVGTKLKAHGPLLVTHWGVSGPAVLKLSSYAARWLCEHDYQAQISINWMDGMKEEDVVELLVQMAEDNPQKQVANIYPHCFNNRLWTYLLESCQIRHDMRWAELGRKGFNRIASRITNHTLNVVGKNRFKDEFVTCGGVALSNINPSTMECKKHEGLYFAGEVLDVDAITGGFNLQAAWTMGFVVAKSIFKKTDEKNTLG